MTHYKQRRNARAVEEDYPHFVEIVVPPAGLGERLAAMYDFHARHAVAPQRGFGRRDGDAKVIRWCFADLEMARAFAAEFKQSD